MTRRSSWLSSAAVVCLLGASSCGGEPRPAAAPPSSPVLPVTPAAPVVALLLEPRKAEGTNQDGVFQSLSLLDHVGAVVGEPLFTDSKVAIGGYSISTDGSWLTVVQVNKASYSGAIVPFYLDDVRITVVDVRTHTQKSVTMTPTCRYQSIAVTLQPPGSLTVRLKDVWNGASDRRATFSCSLDVPVCAPGATLPASIVAAGPTVEVTATAGYRLPLAAEGGLKPEQDPRSLRRSPNGSSLAYVRRALDEQGEERAVRRSEPRQEYAGMGRSTLAEWRPVRELWVGTAKRQQRVYAGEGEVHAEWLDDDLLVFEADEDPAPREPVPGSASRQLRTYRPSTGAVTTLPHTNARLGGTFERVRVVGAGIVVQVSPDVGPAEEALQCEEAPTDP